MKGDIFDAHLSAVNEVLVLLGIGLLFPERFDEGMPAD